MSNIIIKNIIGITLMIPHTSIPISISYPHLIDIKSTICLAKDENYSIIL